MEPQSSKSPNQTGRSFSHLAETCTRQAFSPPLRPLQGAFGSKGSTGSPCSEGPASRARAGVAGGLGSTRSPEPPVLPRSSSQHGHARACKFDHAQERSCREDRFGNLSVVVSSGSDPLLAEYVHPGHVLGCPPSRGARMNGAAFQTAPGSGLGQDSSGHAGLLACHGTLDHGHAVAAGHIDLFPTISRSRSLDPCFRPLFRGGMSGRRHATTYLDKMAPLALAAV